MLDQFLAGLSNEAQLKVALRFSGLSLPIWDRYFEDHPDELGDLNALVTEERRIKGAFPEIKVDLPARTLRELRESLRAAREKSERPATIMRENPRLMPYLLTFMGPLTNPEFERILSPATRLVFTSIWNMLTWLLYRERTDVNETHIYVAVNQSADALLREKVLTADELNAILSEYGAEKRGGDEDNESAMKYGGKSSDSESSRDEVYQKIIGPVPPRDAPSKKQAREIVRQMREEGKSYWDEWEEYHTGTNVDYSYDKKQRRFKRVESDVIVGSFCNTHWMSEEEIIAAMQKYSLSDLRESGFHI